MYFSDLTGLAIDNNYVTKIKTIARYK